MLRFLFVLLAVLSVATAVAEADPDPDPESAPHRPILCQRSRHCQLELGIHSDCVKRLCVCIDDAVYSTAMEMPTCFKPQAVIGGTCESTAECKVPGTQCIRNVCECVSGCVPSSDNSSCLAGGKQLGEYCEVDEQCENSAGDVVCISNGFTANGWKTCCCKPGYIQDYGRCYKKQTIGESCENYINCGHIPNSICNVNCTCCDGFVTNTNNTACLPVATYYGSSCVEDAQCSERLGDDVVCINASCVCKSGLEFDHDDRKCKSIEDAVTEPEEAVEKIGEESNEDKKTQEKKVKELDKASQVRPNAAKSESENGASVQTIIPSLLMTLVLLIQFT